MAENGWVNFAKAAPILLPGSLLRCWHGFYLPAPRDDADLELPRQAYRICDDFDFAQPKTDYERACAALQAGQAVAKVRAGPGVGLVFAAVNGPLAWWRERRVLVNGRELPAAGRLQEVRWSEGVEWAARGSEFVLMNACDHGRNPDSLGPRLRIRLAPGRYLVQSGRYGWANTDPILDLFRFVPKPGRRTRRGT
jgi:hypothetical protein